MCCPLVFEFSVGIGGFCHMTGSDLLLFFTVDDHVSECHVKFGRGGPHNV